MKSGKALFGRHKWVFYFFGEEKEDRGLGLYWTCLQIGDAVPALDPLRGVSALNLETGHRNVQKT